MKFGAQSRDTPWPRAPCGPRSGPGTPFPAPGGGTEPAHRPRSRETRPKQLGLKTIGRQRSQQERGREGGREGGGGDRKQNPPATSPIPSEPPARPPAPPGAPPGRGPGRSPLSICSRNFMSPQPSPRTPPAPPPRSRPGPQRAPHSPRSAHTPPRPRGAGNEHGGKRDPEPPLPHAAPEGAALSSLRAGWCSPLRRHPAGRCPGRSRRLLLRGAAAPARERWLGEGERLGGGSSGGGGGRERGRLGRSVRRGNPAPLSARPGKRSPGGASEQHPPLPLPLPARGRRRRPSRSPQPPPRGRG